MARVPRVPVLPAFLILWWDYAVWMRHLPAAVYF